MTPEAGTSPPVLEVRDLRTSIGSRSGKALVVEGISFSLRAGETLGVVGESGSGKTMLGLSLLRLLPTAARPEGGQVILDGRDTQAIGEREMRAVRGAEIAFIPQDPMVSLDPLFRVGMQIAETLRAHNRIGAREARAEAVELLRRVNIPDPEQRAASYPFEMSGGMRQRAVGAIGIACTPKLLIADEPTTALDVTVQAQYLALLKRLQRETDVALIMITHDLGVVAQSCDQVAVMYAGRVVEQAGVHRLFDAPAHPYSRALIDASASMSTAGTGRRFPTIPGEPPPLFGRSPGCQFAPRCPFARDRCHAEMPGETAMGSGEHTVRCFYPLKDGTQ